MKFQNLKGFIMKKPIFIISALFTIACMIQSCSKDDTDTDADARLFSEASNGGYTYYQDGNILPGVSPSPHGSFKLRFNATANAALDTTGELQAGNSFPSGSIIVKEIYSSGNLSFYAVMKKDPSNNNAGKGWIWAEYNADGSTAFSTGKKGDGCTGCHSISPNRDLTKTFDLH